MSVVLIVGLGVLSLIVENLLVSISLLIFEISGLLTALLLPTLLFVIFLI